MYESARALPWILTASNVLLVCLREMSFHVSSGSSIHSAASQYSCPWSDGSTPPMESVYVVFPTLFRRTSPARNLRV